MKEINPEHTKTVLKIINNCPFFKLLNIEIVELGFGYSKLHVNLENKHLNPFGGLHGGVYSSVIDTAAYWAIYYELEENMGFISIDLNVNNLAPKSEGKLIVEGKRIKVGRTICLAEAKIIDENKKILAHGSSKMFVAENIQTINQALSNAELMKGEIGIPPKFINYKTNK